MSGISYSYTPLSEDQQIVESGMVLASGEANFADLYPRPLASGQVIFSGVANFTGPLNNPNSPTQRPGNSDGINLQDTRSGATTSDGVVLEDLYEGSGDYNLFLDPSFRTDKAVESSDAKTKTSAGLFSPRNHQKYVRPRVDLTVFQPYIHYYPGTSTTVLSLYSTIVIQQPFYIDFSLIFSLSNYYNVYGGIYTTIGSEPTGPL